LTDTHIGQLSATATSQEAHLDARRTRPTAQDALTAGRMLLDGLARGTDRQNAKLQYAVLAAAAVHGGTVPDLASYVQ
jgi:hypothetical protein